MNITATLTDSFNLWAEYESKNGDHYLSCKVDREDFHAFANLGFRMDDVIEDKNDYYPGGLDYGTWFDDHAEDIRKEYAKSLPAYKLFQKTVEAMENVAKAKK